MSVAQVILLSLGVPLLLAGLVLGMMLPMVKASELWAGIPREVLRRHQFGWRWVRPSVWWWAVWGCGVAGDVCRWRQEQHLALVFRGGGGLLMMVAAVLSMVWAGRILRQRRAVPGALYGFAALVVVFGGVVVVLGAWECYEAMRGI